MLRKPSKKPKPKWDYVPTAWIASSFQFNENDKQILIEILGAVGEVLIPRIEQVTSQYKGMSPAEDGAPTPGEVNAALDEVMNSAIDLATKLECLRNAVNSPILTEILFNRHKGFDFLDSTAESMWEVHSICSLTKRAIEQHQGDGSGRPHKNESKLLAVQIGRILEDGGIALSKGLAGEWTKVLGIALKAAGTSVTDPRNLLKGLPSTFKPLE